MPGLIIPQGYDNGLFELPTPKLRKPKIARVEVVTGPMGAGKSSYLARAAWLTYVINRGEANIMGTFALNIPGYVEIDKDSLVEMYVDEDPFLQDGMILMDEGYAYMDSRLSQSYLNRFMNRFAKFVRKMNLYVIISAHNETMLDKRIRQSMTKKVQMVPPYDTVNHVASALIFPINPPKPKYAESYYMAPYYGLFDTDEKVSTGGKTDNWKKLKEKM